MRRQLCILFLFCFLFSFKGLAQDRNIRLGDMFFEKERFPTALYYYKMAFPDYPEDAQLNLQMARCYVRIGEATKAREHITTSFEKAKKPTFTMKFTLAEIYQLEQKFDLAIKYFKAADPYDGNKRITSKRINECQFGKKYLKKPTKAKIINMGETINSPQHDILPKITADRLKLYFASHRNTFTKGKKRGEPEDIYFSLNQAGSWTNPENIGPPVNTENNDAIVGLSQDGQTMFIFRGSNGGDIYKSELKGKKWSEPQPMPFNTPLRESSICISPDNRSLFFVRGSETGNSNIYQCKRNARGSWSSPKKLGKNINSPYDEESPYMHPDGKTLYFSSKGHSSMGGFDVFKSVYDEKTGTWGEPENLGSPINTSGDELGFVLSADGLFGYYSSSNPGGFGGQDLYTIRMPVKKNEHNLVLLKGAIQDELSGSPIEANITVTDNETGEKVAEFRSNSATGEYLVSLPSGRDYGITIEKQGSLFHSEHISLTKQEGYATEIKNIKLTNTRPGATIVLKNIFFESGSSELSPSSYPELSRLTGLLKKYPDLKVEISGHTDDIGNEETNQLLSEKRAKAVVAYLVSQGVSSRQLVAKGYGSQNPLGGNDTEEGRKLNRRTEFRILE